MRPHPFRRASDRAHPWVREEADLLARARGDHELEAILRAAQTAEPADVQAFRQQMMALLAPARVIAGGANMLPSMERALLLHLIDSGIRIIETFEPEN